MKYILIILGILLLVTNLFAEVVNTKKTIESIEKSNKVLLEQASLDQEEFYILVQDAIKNELDKRVFEIE